MEQTRPVFMYATMSLRETMGRLMNNYNIPAITGVLRGWVLCLQRLDQVPEAPRKILADAWGRSFQTYTIRPGNPDDAVAGVLWELTPLEFYLLADWELCGLGWFKEEKVMVELPSGDQVEAATFVLGPGQKVGRDVREDNYRIYPVPRDRYLELLGNSRAQFLERVRDP